MIKMVYSPFEKNAITRLIWYSYTRQQLRDFAKRLDIPTGRNKEDVLHNILTSEKVGFRIRLEEREDFIG